MPFKITCVRVYKVTLTLASFLVSITKCLTKGNLRKGRFIVAHSSRMPLITLCVKPSKEWTECKIRSIKPPGQLPPVRLHLLKALLPSLTEAGTRWGASVPTHTPMKAFHIQSTTCWAQTDQQIAVLSAVFLSPALTQSPLFLLFSVSCRFHDGHLLLVQI